LCTLEPNGTSRRWTASAPPRQEPGEVLAQKLEARRRQVAQPTASPDFDGASARRERDPVPESPAKPTAHELARHQQARLTIACDLHEERC
jgi:hypothetical protein